jgi:ABC-2 type transport system permease protein
MLRTLYHYVRLYFLIESQYIKARMQYRLDFIISSIGMVFTGLVTVFVFQVLFETIPTLAGWTFNEILFIYGFFSLAAAPQQIFFDNIWFLRYKVQDGSFIKYYFRPLNMMFYYMSETIDLKGFTLLAIGIATLVYASIQLGLQWTPLRLLLLATMLLSASLVAISFMTIAACSTFWIVNSYPVMALALKIRDFAQYPMTVFDGFARFLFTYMIPIGFIAFYPAQLFLRPEEVSILVYLSPLVGIAFFALAYFVWHKGVNSYSGTGS